MVEREAGVTRLITGHTLEELEFQKRWAQFLRQISERIYKKPEDSETSNF